MMVQQTATQQQVQIAAQLYEMRDKARRLLGDSYKPQMVALGKVLETIAEREGKQPLSVAIASAKERNLVGMDLLLLMAAAVELTEPSPN